MKHSLLRIYRFLFPERCPFCRSSRLVWDNGRDFNLCAKCGAVETTKGWTQGKVNHHGSGPAHALVV